MFTEHEAAQPLRVPKRVPADYWLKGYKMGYYGEAPQPPRGRSAAENYWRGYGEGQAAARRSSRRQATAERKRKQAHAQELARAEVIA